MIDFVEAVRSESDAFAAVAATATLSDPVPSCPDWTAADLIWHLTEVQHFWASVVEDLLHDPAEAPAIERPAADDLLEAFGHHASRLVSALANRRPNDPCWSWHDDGHTVGWVRRRQAHEALIHRVDADLVTGETPVVDAGLAADGIDEIFRFLLSLDNLPDWAEYVPDGTTAKVELLDGSAAWTMNFGRFRGSSPVSGNTYDLPALQLTDLEGSPSVTIRGEPNDLDLWLWGRGSRERLNVEGSLEIAEKLRNTAADSTQ